MTIDPDGCIRLLCAVAKQWARDAQRDESELALLAGWLDMPTDDLRRRLNCNSRRNDHAAV